MAVRVSEVDLINEEAHRKGSIPAEVVIFIANVDVPHIQLDALEERSEET